MKFRPLDDRVVVEPLEAEEKTAGGILLPDTAKEKPQRGKVLAVGPGKLARQRRPRSRWVSRSATKCSSASTPAPRSKSTARTQDPAARATSWQGRARRRSPPKPRPPDQQRAFTTKREQSRNQWLPRKSGFDDDARDQDAARRRQARRRGEGTLGPTGRNVILDKSFGAPRVTKDGVTVAKEIELADPFENMGAKMVNEVASKTSDLAGDGTTTATVLAAAIVREGAKASPPASNPMD